MSDSLTIKRPVIVKVKVTEGFKARMAAEIQENIKRLDAEMQQLEFQVKRMAAELEKKIPRVSWLPNSMWKMKGRKE